MDNIVDKIKNIQYKTNFSLQKDLQKLNPTELRNIAQNFKIVKTGDKSKSKKLIKLILAFYKENKCSQEKPCENLDETCNLETGKCIKSTITDQYGQTKNVIGTTDVIKSIQTEISTIVPSIQSSPNPILDYRLKSFLDDGMTDVDNNGDCFFICVQKLLFITHEVEYDIPTIRDKISQTLKLLTITTPPILDSSSLLNELSNISSLDDYISIIKSSGWAGEPEIISASCLFNKIIIVKTLRLNIPDRIYFPSIQLPNRNVQPGMWVIYHTNKEVNKFGNHYQYKGNNTNGIYTGSIKDINLLEEILTLTESLQQDISPSMSMLSSDGIQYAGNPESLEALNKKGIIKTKTSSSSNFTEDISLPPDEDSIKKPDEQKIISKITSKPIEDNPELQSDIKRFLYPE